MTKPTVGSIVIYTASEHDAKMVNDRRKQFEDHCRDSGISAEHSVFKGPMGNSVNAGDEFAAMIVRVWGNEDTSSVNLRVFLDGNDTFWAPSRIQNDSRLPGSYRFPQLHPTQAAAHVKTEDSAPTPSNSRPNISPRRTVNADSKKE